MMKGSGAWIAALVLLSVPAVARETITPRRIGAPSDLRPGEAALLLSIRLSVPQSSTASLWFAAVESAQPEPKYLKFQRYAALSSWRRVLDRDVHVYAIPAGRWRLHVHAVGCKEIVDEQHLCIASRGGNAMRTSSALYPAAWLVIDAPAGSFVDANELMLELPLPAAGDQELPETWQLQMALRFKLLPIPVAEKPGAATFAAAPKTQITAAPKARSNIQCDRPSTIGDLHYIPFTC